MNEISSIITAIAAIISAVVAALAFSFKFWKWYRRSFKQDFDRYRQVMENISVSDIYYFRYWENLYHNFPEERYDGIHHSALALSNFHFPRFIDKKLLKKERKLIEALIDMTTLMKKRLYYNPSRFVRTTCTIYHQPGGYDATDPEHRRKVGEIKTELDNALDCLIEAYEDFLNYGNRKFAERLPEHDS